MKQAPDKLYKEVIAQMKAARIEQGLSHEVLAQRAGVTRPTISYIESGKIKPTLFVCLKIADALCISLGKIIIEAEKG